MLAIVDDFVTIFVQPEGDFAKNSETSVAFNDKKAQRPVIHRLYDHGSQVIPEGKLSSRFDLN
jgi:hypothetical protein